MRERPIWRDALIGGDAIDARTFVARVERSLKELGYVATPRGPFRPMCHLAKGGGGAWVAGLTHGDRSAVAEVLVSTLAPAERPAEHPLFRIDARVRRDGSGRSAPSLDVEVEAFRLPPAGGWESLPLPSPPEERVHVDGADGSSAKDVAADAARKAIEWAWAQVRVGRTVSRIPLGAWSLPAAGFERVAGITDPAEALFVGRLLAAKERELVVGTDGKAILRIVHADGTKQTRALEGKERLWAKRVLG